MLKPVSVKESKKYMLPWAILSFPVRCVCVCVCVVSIKVLQESVIKHRVGQTVGVQTTHTNRQTDRYRQVIYKIQELSLILVLAARLYCKLIKPRDRGGRVSASNVSRGRGIPWAPGDLEINKTRAPLLNHQKYSTLDPSSYWLDLIGRQNTVLAVKIHCAARRNPVSFDLQDRFYIHL